MEELSNKGTKEKQYAFLIQYQVRQLMELSVLLKILSLQKHTFKESFLIWTLIKIMVCTFINMET